MSEQVFFKGVDGVRSSETLWRVIVLKLARWAMRMDRWSCYQKIDDTQLELLLLCSAECI